jgi:16S rRNA (guanine527-N7)-methyltransferase
VLVRTVIYPSAVTSKAFLERLERRARHAGVVVAPAVAQRLETYFRLLARWNARINLTSVQTQEPNDATFDRLLIEPLAAASHVDPSWTPWIDVGSGGGSPALPMKAAKPSLHLTMVESKARKAAFLREAARTLGFGDVSVENIRIEDLAGSAEVAGLAGLITMRAVRTDTRRLRVLAELLRNQGVLMLFRNLPSELNYAGFKRESSFLLVPSVQRPAYLVTYRRMFHVEQSA